MIFFLGSKTGDPENVLKMIGSCAFIPELT